MSRFRLALRWVSASTTRCSKVVVHGAAADGRPSADLGRKPACTLSVPLRCPALISICSVLAMPRREQGSLTICGGQDLDLHQLLRTVNYCTISCTCSHRKSRWDAYVAVLGKQNL